MNNNNKTRTWFTAMDTTAISNAIICDDLDDHGLHFFPGWFGRQCRGLVFDIPARACDCEQGNDTGHPHLCNCTTIQ